MKILLITNYKQEGNTGNLASKALKKMGHSIHITDCLYGQQFEKDDFDITITWTNNFPNPKMLPGKHKICYYLDDCSWWRIHNPNLLPEICTAGYDYVFTCNKWEGYNEKLFRWIPFGCYSQDTELLTINGFKLFRDITKDDLIATLNDKNYLEYHKPIAIQNYFYQGKMINFKGKYTCDLLVTPEHNIYHANRKCKGITEFKKSKALKLINTTKNSIAFKKDCYWNGEEQEYIEIEGSLIYYNRWNNTRNIKKEIIKFKTIDFLEFLGWFLSEGNIQKTKKREYKIIIHQNNKSNIVKIKELMTRLPCKSNFIIRKRKMFEKIITSGEFRIHSKTLYNYFKQFGKCQEKYIPKEIKKLNKNCLLILLKSLFLGDGHISKDGKLRTYTTTSKKLAGDIQEILLKSGLGSSIHMIPKEIMRKYKGSFKSNFNIYRISVNHSKKTPVLCKKPEIVDYKDNVYCVTVPNNIIFVRRNGKVVWCGNCDEEIHKKVELTPEEKEMYKTDVLFIGTNRGNRPLLIKKLAENFTKFKLFGNNWEGLGIQSKAIYFEEYVKAISGAKIFIAEHYDNCPSTKDFEVPCVGGALMISDKEKMKEIYPMMPIYKNYDEAVKIAKYYLEHEEERQKLVKEMKEIALSYTYEKQLGELFKIIGI